MRKSQLYIVVALTLLPITVVAIQDNMELMKLTSIQLAQSDTAAGSRQQPGQSYLKSIAKEAVRSNMAKAARPISEQTAVPNSSNQNPSSVPTRNKVMRTDQIKSIVAGAAVNAKPEQPVRQLSQPILQQPIDIKKIISPNQQRRQQLQKVIFSAPAAKDKATIGYVSLLQDEVSTTVVFNEESARRPAVPVTKKLAVSVASMLPKFGGTRLYKVQTGDTLWRIAQRFYRDGNKYVDLCQANRDLLADEDLLHVGQVLRVPKL